MSIREFECLSCHHRFEADDRAMVICPQCESDNVEPAHFHMPHSWWKWCLGVALAGAALWIILSVDWKTDDTQQTVEEEFLVAETDTTTHYMETTDTTVIKDTGLTLPIAVEMRGEPQFENGGYSFSVIVKNAPQEMAYDVVLLDPYDNTTVIARSKDGHFTGVPPSEQEGKYDLALIDTSNGTLLTAPLKQVGFIKQETVAKMSKEQLQQLIMSNDIYKGAGENPQLASEVKITYTGAVTTAEGPTTLSEVKDMLEFGGWQKIDVISVSYDALNRVSAVTINVTLETETTDSF